MPTFSLLALKHETNKLEEYCWVMTCGRQSCCSLQDFSELEFGFQVDSLVYTHTVDHTYTQLWHACNSACALSSGIKILQKFGNVCTESYCTTTQHMSKQKGQYNTNNIYVMNV
jgi:hypothetical protein